MVRRILLVGLLVVSLTAIVGTDASAAICRMIGGYCVAYTKGIECGISATGVGNVLKDPVYLGCEATGTNEWVVACGNPGSKTWASPGIQTVSFSGSLENTVLLDQSQVDKNGNAYGTVIVKPVIGEGLLQAMTEAGVCPNLNWVAIDASPCTMTLHDVELDSGGCVLAEAYFECTLPNCSTLAWDSANQRFERRQYDCVQKSSIKYNKPQCPPPPQGL